MNLNVKRRWLEALRGGKYKQCREVLHNSYHNAYCCMGVLAKVADLHTDAELMDGVSGWETFCGIDKAQGERLARMNDDGNSFTEIADYIEANL